jgi:hypothetical protein
VDKAGVGSAVVNSMRQVGGAVGLAVIGAIMATQFDPARPTPHDYANAFQLGLRVAAGIAFVGVLVAAFGIRQQPEVRRAAEPATELG